MWKLFQMQVILLSSEKSGRYRYQYLLPKIVAYLDNITQRQKKTFIATPNFKFYGDDFPPKIYPPMIIKIFKKFFSLRLFQTLRLSIFMENSPPYVYSIPYDYQKLQSTVIRVLKIFFGDSSNSYGYSGSYVYYIGSARQENVVRLCWI